MVDRISRHRRAATEPARAWLAARVVGKKRERPSPPNRLLKTFKPASLPPPFISSNTLQGFRWTKEVGLGFKTPKEAKTGTYVDKKCPFTGNVSIRGRILKGIVVSTKMTRTLIIRRDYLHWISKYKRCVRG